MKPTIHLIFIFLEIILAITIVILIRDGLNRFYKLNTELKSFNSEIRVNLSAINERLSWIIRDLEINTNDSEGITTTTEGQ